MREFRDKTAVVTGAASGIGRALCGKFVSLGMNVVLADIEAEKAEAVASELATDSLVVATDVSEAASVEELADRSFERFGAVHVLCNNAGVFTGGSLWDAPFDGGIRVGRGGAEPRLLCTAAFFAESGGSIAGVRPA